jgi:hypothetical protein
MRLSGKSCRVKSPPPSLSAQTLKKPAAPKIEIRKPLQVESASPVLPRKIFRFIESPNQPHASRVPCSSRGAYASSRTLSAGCGGRVDAARRAASFADGEIVWSRRPDAGADLAMMLSHHADDGDNKAWSSGRSRISRKTIAQGMPAAPAEPVVLPRAFLLHADHGCSPHPAFPAPSCLSRDVLV